MAGRSSSAAPLLMLSLMEWISMLAPAAGWSCWSHTAQSVMAACWRRLLANSWRFSYLPWNDKQPPPTLNPGLAVRFTCNHVHDCAQLTDAVKLNMLTCKAEDAAASLRSKSSIVDFFAHFHNSALIMQRFNIYNYICLYLRSPVVSLHLEKMSFFELLKNSFNEQQQQHLAVYLWVLLEIWFWRQNLAAWLFLFYLEREPPSKLPETAFLSVWYRQTFTLCFAVVSFYWVF